MTINLRSVALVAAFLIRAQCASTTCCAGTLIDSDFSKGSFAGLGWVVKGDRDVFGYPTEAALDQFKPGWSHTAVYLIRDRTDEGGNQSFGFFTRDYTTRKAAVYLHNFTTILADQGSSAVESFELTVSDHPLIVAIDPK